MSKTVAILQARMTSSRLPGKVLQPISGAPMILRQIERIKRCETIDELVVATTTDAEDDVLVEILTAHGITVSRGARDDVLSRFIDVIDQHSPDTVIRLTADCPLTSPDLIDEVVLAFRRSQVDYLSNSLIPSFPDGLDVEVTVPDVLIWLNKSMTGKTEREHVTLGIYTRPSPFIIANFGGKEDLAHHRWTVDTHDDLEFVSRVYEKLYPIQPNFETSDILNLIADMPELERTKDHYPRNHALSSRLGDEIELD